MTRENDLIRRGDAFAVVKGLSLLEGDILALPAAPLDAPKHLTDTLDAALKGYAPGVDRAVRWLSIDQVDMLAEFYLNQRRGRG